MISKFRKFIEKEGLFKKDDKILLACSGGIDSMVLADLLLINENRIGIAHINHQTRAEESDQDQQFVESFCADRNIECHTISRPIAKMADEANENFHAYARSFRYKYFYETLEHHNFSYIATAHHSSDSIETFFINLMRGAGLDGLTGIPHTNQKVIRPLMFASKDEIVSYANKFKIAYREDQSNSSNKYKRNHIRHELIPKLTEIDIDANRNINSSLEKLKNTKLLLQELLSQHNLIDQVDNRFLIKIKGLQGFNNRPTLLFYLLKDFGFNFSQCQQINASIKSIGSTFYSPSHLLLIDRESLMIELLKELTIVDFIINEPGTYKLPNGNSLIIEETNQLDKNSNCEYLNKEKLGFPLTVRNWKEGDKFSPLGMKGQQKKIKDYLIDNKIDRLSKKDQLVLISNGEIAWLVDQRISEKYKYTESTKQFLKLKYLK